MAIGATAVWEVRANASNSGLQGGFYVTTGGSTDYSQQDTAQLVLTDIASDGAGTALSSATGGFTSAMVGNGMYITGGGTTAGWYQIATYVDGNNITIDRSCGASKTNVTGRIGGATICANTPLSIAVAGNTIYIKADGTHTLAANCSLSNSSANLRAKVIGYNTTRGDAPTGTNRPYIACGAYYFSAGDYWGVENLRFTGSAAAMVVDNQGYYKNCKAQNDSVTASRVGMRMYFAGAFAIDCEIISDAGVGVDVQVGQTAYYGCYIHDCGTMGLSVGSVGTYWLLDHTIVDTCPIGISGTTGVKGPILNCVFYNCSTAGVQLTTATSLTILNTIFDTCTIGIDLSDGQKAIHYENYNNFYNCTTDRNYILVGDASVDADPSFTNSASGDFSLNGGAMIDAGFALRLGVGA